MKIIFVILFFFTLSSSHANNIYKKIERLSENVENSVVKWRRHIHQNPELSNREFMTAKYVSDHLKSLGLEVQENIAHTGVVAILEGGHPGGVVALRADMDALPVTERVDLPFASKVKTIYKDVEVGVMHACGHDTHVAILMGVASVLTEIREEIKGTVKFIFQPAEEGAPDGEEGGAELMVKEGVLKNPDVDAIFGLHISSGVPINTLTYKPGGTMASATSFEIKIKGKQAHGSRPWEGADPIVAGAQIINNLQTIVSRNLDLTNEAAVVTIGRFESGIRSNIIPESAYMEGTIRALDYEMRDEIYKRLKEIVVNTAKSNNLEAEVILKTPYPITYNDLKITDQMKKTLFRVAGENNVKLARASTGAEDFSYFANKVPGFFFRLGGMPIEDHPNKGFSHHTPDFYIDDSGLILGVRAMANLAVDYLNTN
ncbi:MAG: N-acyl-L-amino acid amidohydrolase [Flammeovirgaceae bacterium]|nr:N-acyl-L-amino acid amidohydrolase [Flammeovirgaceae bacterium]